MVTICLCLAGVVGATDLLREGRERAERYARCDRPRAEYRKYEAMTAGFGRSAPSWTAQKLLSAGGAVYVTNQKSGTHFVEALLGGAGARWYYQKFRNADPAAAWFANARFEREASRDPRSAALACDATQAPPAVFTVVRDPFESFASAFLEAMCVERDGRGTFAGNRKPEFAAFAAPRRPGEGPSMTMSHDNATRLFEQYVADVRRGARMSRLFIHGWPRAPARERGATFPTSKAPSSAVFHSFRLFFGRAIVSRSAWMFYRNARARNTHVEATLHHPFAAQADDCVARSNKYAVVILGAFPPPAPPPAAAGGRPPVVVAIARHPRDRYRAAAARASPRALDDLDRCLDAARGDCFEASLGLAPDADVRWFCGGDCGARAGERAADAALRRAADAVVVLGATPAATVAELERALPSHFLRLGAHVKTARRLSDDRGVAKQMRHAGGATLVRRKDADAKRHARREAAFVAASAEDAAFYDAAAKAERERGARCRKP